MVVIIHMTMEHLIRDTNNSSVSEIAKDGSKGIRFPEVGAHVPVIAVITSLKHILVESRISGATKNGLERGRGEIVEKSLIDCGPVNTGIGETGGHI